MFHAFVFLKYLIFASCKKRPLKLFPETFVNFITRAHVSYLLTWAKGSHENWKASKFTQISVKRASQSKWFCIEIDVPEIFRREKQDSLFSKMQRRLPSRAEWHGYLVKRQQK